MFLNLNNSETCLKQNIYEMENCPYWKMSLELKKTYQEPKKLPNTETEGKASV
jgi:hypothetical protein